MAAVFLNWLNLPNNLSWIEIGCGTGALSEAIYNNCKPLILTCIDPSIEFLEKTRDRLMNKVDFQVGSSSNIPRPNHLYDIAVSGLALNFFPDLKIALSEMKRVLKPNGIIAAYVWDYAGRMDFLRLFWDTACEIDKNAKRYDEGIIFPICSIENLKDVFSNEGMAEIAVSLLDIDTVFIDFHDFWNPFKGGQGPAPGYLASLDKELQEAIKEKIQKKLLIHSDGSFKLLARAIAIRGVVNQ